jgi:hypothetical protein
MVFKGRDIKEESFNKKWIGWKKGGGSWEILFLYKFFDIKEDCLDLLKSVLSEASLFLQGTRMDQVTPLLNEAVEAEYNNLQQLCASLCLVMSVIYRLHIKHMNRGVCFKAY